MNWVQRVVVVLGVLAFALVGLFPPNTDNELRLYAATQASDWSAVSRIQEAGRVSQNTWFLAAHKVAVDYLAFEWTIVAVVTVGLFFAFRSRVATR